MMEVRIGPDAVLRTVPLLMIAAGIVGLGYALASDILAFAGCAALVCLLLIQAYTVTRNFSSLAFVFSLFFAVYGLSGPWQVLSGQMVHPIFGEDFDLPAILGLVSIGGLGYGLGATTGHLILAGRCPSPDAESALDPLVARRFRVYGVLVAGLGSVMEAVNFLRVGGLASFVLGKAQYQTKVSELAGTLPGFQLLVAGAIFTGLGLSGYVGRSGASGKVSRGLATFGIASSVALLIALGLGRRGAILGVVIALFLALFYFRPLRRVRRRLVVAGLLVYCLMGFMYSARPFIGFSLATGDWDFFVQNVFERERLLRAFNPGTSEFGAPFGNLGLYLREGSDPPYWGETYERSLATLVPGFAYPGTKPQQINYEFRDRYFPGENRKGGIAGPGFSAVLEAFMNFRVPGVLLVYFMIGLAVVVMERARGTGSILFAAAYCVAGPLTQLWHRSQFGFVLGKFVIGLALIIMCLAIFEFVRAVAELATRRNGALR